jgi:benzoate/toluate 1,2-dioxygenase beta subunit/2,4,5-trichlorophenoxyacetic acid oxygenase 2
MPATDATGIASHILALEGLLLDRRDWTGWIELYRPDVIYRIPAWRDDGRETEDPDREVSLIYHDSRLGLEERAFRLGQGRTLTAAPLPRTAHFVSNVVASATSDRLIAAEASWCVHLYQPRTDRQTVHFGRYDVQLRLEEGRWQFIRKTIHLQNDRTVSGVLDIHMV